MTDTTTKSLALGAGIAAVALLAGHAQAQSTTQTKVPTLTFADVPGTGDVKVLNYALALEDAEADLYVQAIGRLTNGATSGIGTTIPGLGLPADRASVQYLTVFGTVEAQHRDFLRAAITQAGATAITPFAYDFGLETMTEQQVVELIYGVENTGVQAYLGAIPSFSPTSPYLQTAASIQATEARHTASVAIVLNALFGEGKETAPLVGEGLGKAGIDSSLTPDQVLAAVSGPNGFIYTPAVATGA